MNAAGTKQALAVLRGEASLDDVTRRRVERARAEQDRRDQQKFREAVIARRLATANLPARLTDEATWHFHGLPRGYADEALTWCHRETLEGFLVLQGPRGCGKSSIAALCLMECARRREIDRPLYARSCDVLRALSGRDAGRVWWEADLLVLDDLDSERSPAPWAVDAFCDLLDSRWQSGAPTIITTNRADRDHLCRLYGERIASRLLDRRKNAALLWSADAPDWRAVGE